MEKYHNRKFTVCQNYRSDLNSHMMKNSEWGSVAYLSQSSYGKSEEIWINNSSSYITGSAGNSVSAGIDEGTTNDYTSTQGQEASTTGTVYGIYDMSGGSWECIAAYIDNGHDSLEINGLSCSFQPFWGRGGKTRRNFYHRIISFSDILVDVL